MDRHTDWLRHKQTDGHTHKKKNLEHQHCCQC